MNAVESALASYRALLAKVDEKFNEILARNKNRMKCGEGCHSCCVPKLTVFGIEKRNLKQHILSRPGLADELRVLEKADPHKGTRCRFLDEKGQCAVYEARPLVCRSHGAPLFSKEEEKVLLDACPLNFTDIENLAKLANSDFMNLDLLNSILAKLDLAAGGSNGERFALQVDDLLK